MNNSDLMSQRMLQNQDNVAKDRQPITKKDYKTFSKAEKGNLMEKFKEKVIESHWEEGSKISEITSKKVLTIIRKWPQEKFDKILMDILPEYDPDFKIKGTNLVKFFREWRKRIKNWLENAEKSDNRGGRLLVHQQNDSDQEILKFRELAITKVLSKMIFRDLKELKHRFLTLMQNIEYSEDSSLKRTFDATNFSKHWWWEQCRKDIVLKQAWKKLPVKRNSKKKRKIEIEIENIEALTSVTTQEQTPEPCNQESSPKRQTFIIQEDSTYGRECYGKFFKNSSQNYFCCDYDSSAQVNWNS